MALATTPKVSVITCFLNLENYLEETIKSVLAQEYTNWELLLVDDGSEDKSTSIARQYAEQYPDKIFYFEHENHKNKGASYSRNLAISKATGEFVAFLDGDDVWLPLYLTHQLELLAKHKTDIVFEASEYWHSWTNDGRTDYIIPVGAQQDLLHQPPGLLLKLYPLGRGAAPCICGIVANRDIILKHGGFDDAFAGMYDDQALLVKLYLHEAVYISSATHNRYRQRPDSLVHTSHRQGNYQAERKHFLEWLELYLQSQHTSHQGIKKLLHQALFPYRYPGLYFLTKKAPQKLKKLLAKVLPSGIKSRLTKPSIKV